MRNETLQAIADALEKEWSETGYCPMPKSVCQGEANEGFMSDCGGHREHSRRCPFGAYLKEKQ